MMCRPLFQLVLISLLLACLAWSAQGKEGGSPSPLSQQAAPEFHAIVCGIDQYSSPELHLQFASSDADAMARVLKVGAEHLFGPDHVYITLLKGTVKKADLQAAFAQRRQMKPGDVLVVYLSGHGTAPQGSYCYLTSEAVSRELIKNDPLQRQKASVQSEELVGWLRNIPARKQVIVLDTCEAGAVGMAVTNPARGADATDEGTSRPALQQALVRLQAATGSWWLFGAASGQIVYENPKIEHGLLTFALLEGMHGGGLREDGLVDVDRLFEYAVCRVPQLAHRIGGSQIPEVVKPTTGSFDIGQLPEADRPQVPGFAPVFARPLLMDPNVLDDSLNLTAALGSALDAILNPHQPQQRGIPVVGANRITFESSDDPDAYRVRGTYTVDGVNGEHVRIKLALCHGKQQKAALETEGARKDLAPLIERVAQTLVDRVENPKASIDKGIRLVVSTQELGREKPKCYVLAIGVSGYKMPELRLNYAHKDAEELAQVYQDQKGGLFCEVEVRTLADPPETMHPQATRGNIMDALDWLSKRMTQNDYAVVLISGHGMPDDQGHYYFVPQDCDPEHLLRDGVRWSEIHDVLTNLPGKKLLFLDTCHSGGSDGTVVKDASGAYGQILKEGNLEGSGLITFASCMPTEASAEGPQWHHGVFTKYLLEGLRGKADADGDGVVTLAELDKYITDQVKAERPRQHPTTAHPPSIPNALPLAFAMSSSK